MNLPDNQHLFTVAEIGDFMFGPNPKSNETNKRRVYRLIESGLIDCIKDGSRIYITRKAVYSFLGINEERSC
jgi:hypothetical protein